MWEDRILLSVNGEKLPVPSTYDPSTRLIDVLRSETRFKGPKVGCGEGGCGACTVIVDRLDAGNGAVSRITLNSCLAPIGSLDGAAVTTAEGLGNSKKGFNAAQEALSQRFGSQCGFCSPGMVVAMTAAAAAVEQSTTADQSAAASIARGLDGNLCRCTGWRPIIDACRDIADMEDLHQHCCQLSSSSGSSSGTEQSSCSSVSCPDSSSSSKSCHILPPAEATFPEWLQQYVLAKHRYKLQQQQQQLLWSMDGSSSSSSTSGGQMWLRPGSLSELADMLGHRMVQGHSPKLVAGNTGAGVYKDLWPHDGLVIDLSAVHELHQIQHHDQQQQQQQAWQQIGQQQQQQEGQRGVILGAGVTIQQLIRLLRTPSAAVAQAANSCSAHNKVWNQHCGMNHGCKHSSSSDGKQQCQGAGSCQGAAAAAAPGGCANGAAGPSSSSSGVWSAMADHLERIAGVHVRSAATLGGHFGLCARKPLPTDLALLLAAAGAKLQIMTVARGSLQQQQLQRQGQQYCGAWQQQYSPWQQQHQYDLRWVSVEEYLESSCIGSGRYPCSSSDDVSELTADGIAGAKVMQPAATTQQAFSPITNTIHSSNSNSVGTNMLHTTASSGNAVAGSAASSAAAAAAVTQVITAVCLPYPDDSKELFWSYKLALRHVNSHALVNAALWLKFDQSTMGLTKQIASTLTSSSGVGIGDCYGPSNSSNSSCDDPMQQQQHLNIQADPMFAGAEIVSARLFVGFPPNAPDHTAAGAAAAVVSSSGSGQSDEPWCVTRVREVEGVLQGSPVDLQVIISALRALETHLTTHGNLKPSDFHSQALQGILYKALVPLINPNNPNPQNPGFASDTPAPQNPNPASPKALNPRVQRLLVLPKPYDPRVLPEGRQVLPGFSGDESAGVAPVHLPVEKEGVRLQCSGEAVYAADVAAGMTGQVLYLAGVKSTEALANIMAIDTSGTAAVAGVVGVITADDIPGINKAYDAPLLADGKVVYVGQLIALVAATTQAAADRAAAAVRVTYAPIPDQHPIFTIEQAIAAGSFHNDFPQLHAAAVKHDRLAALRLDRPANSSSSSCDSSSSGASCLEESIHTAESQDQVTSTATKALVDQIITSSPRQITNGSYTLPAQQHMYMETQTAVAEPCEDGAVRVTASTQSLDAVQQVVADVLNIPFNKATVVAKRLGGGFGGKCSRSMPVAAAAALAAAHFGKAVCYSLNRNDDLAINHGRCLGQVTYDVGFDEDGKVHAIKAQVIYRAGAYLDLASNDGATLVTATDSAYDLSGLAVDVKYARCNIPPHTIVRAPGFLQGVMVLEQVMEHVAAVLGMDSAAVKAANFLPDVSSSSSTGSSSSSSSHTISSNMGRLCIASPAAYNKHLQQHNAPAPAAAAAAAADKHVSGQQQQQQQQQQQAGVTTVLGRFISSDTYTLPQIWQQLLSSSKYSDRLAAVQQYNRDNAWSKRGIVVTPVRFDCAPAAVSAAVSIYADGSVLVTHGGIEMGQGLTTKVKQAAVAALSQLLPEEQRPLPLDLVRVAASSSDVVPNGGPTWSSTGSEGNCQAVVNAGAKLVKQMMPHVQVDKDGVSTWKSTIASLYSDAVGFAPSNAMLSAYGYFDGTVGSGEGKQPVQYSAFGAAVTEVEIDVLTGERKVLSTHIKYDCGYPLNPAIDLGQIEGGFVMGLGVMLSEEVVVDDITGATLRSASTWKYKIPTMDLIPQQFTVEFGDLPNPRGIMSSKASGEPAVMASTSALMALQQAVAAAVQEMQALHPSAATAGVSLQQRTIGTSGFCVVSAPATPSKVRRTVGSFSIADVLETALRA